MTTTTIAARDLWRAWRNRPRTRVTAILCPDCGLWRKPRHFTPDAATCRDCN